VTEAGCGDLAARFRFDRGDRVRVLTHPVQPRATILERWTGAALGDPHDDATYAVSGFVTRQRESSLAGEGWLPVPLDTLADWRTAGSGGFRRVGPSMVESEGGPGILWYARRPLVDFRLLVDWRLSSPEDNSGVFLRIPALGQDWRQATEHGWEVQIDDRGVDHDRGVLDSPRHRTGAVYGRAPAAPLERRPVGCWNRFDIEARGPRLTVRLNGHLTATLEDDRTPREGHLGLQAHDPASRVRFRNLQVLPL
jgi:hypothetical protein